MQGQAEIDRLKEIIELKEKEIKDIKFSIADVLLQIRMINESNQYNHPDIIRRKISELCTNARYELLVDELYEVKNRTTTTDQSNK